MCLILFCLKHRKDKWGHSLDINLLKFRDGYGTKGGKSRKRKKKWPTTYSQVGLKRNKLKSLLVVKRRKRMHVKGRGEMCRQ